MRILLFLRRLNAGGAERQFLQLAGGLAARGHEVVLATMLPGGPLAPDVDERVRHHVLLPGATGGVRALLRTPRRLRSFVLDLRPAVVYSALYWSNALAHRAVHGHDVPLVWGLRNAEQVLDWKRAIAFRYDRHRASEVTLAISNSYAGRDAHERMGFRFRRHEVVPNGIDVERFRRDASTSAALREEWGATPDAFVVGLVGRLHENKDVPGFLRAAERFATGIPEARFVVIGDGARPHVEHLHELGRRSPIADRLVWAGRRDDMPAVHGALDLFASTSTVEGFANVVGEAMACETPCVVTDVGDSAHIVGRDGFVVPPGDPAAAAAAWARVHALPEEERQRRGREARRRVAERFGLEACIRRTEDLLAEVARPA
jgi:glycosyltransferase involved in cell wall biosynthesis